MRLEILYSAAWLTIELLASHAHAQGTGLAPTTFQDPDTGSLYVYDAVSGMFYDADNGYLYDPSANLFHPTAAATGPAPAIPRMMAATAPAQVLPAQPTYFGYPAYQIQPAPQTVYIPYVPNYSYRAQDGFEIERRRAAEAAERNERERYEHERTERDREVREHAEREHAETERAGMDERRRHDLERQQDISREKIESIARDQTLDRQKMQMSRPIAERACLEPNHRCR